MVNIVHNIEGSVRPGFELADTQIAGIENGCHLLTVSRQQSEQRRIEPTGWTVLDIDQRIGHLIGAIKQS